MVEGLVLGPLKRGSFGHQMGSLNLISCDEPGDCHPVFLRRLGKLTLKCWKQMIYLQRKQVFFSRNDHGGARTEVGEME